MIISIVLAPFSCLNPLLEKMTSSWAFFAQGLTTIVLLCVNHRVAVASEYTRPGPGRIVLTKHMKPNSYPQQVHVSSVGADHMRVSYITNDSSIPSKVQYGKVSGKYNAVANGDSSHYTYFLYTSGKIHNVKIGPLEPDTVYYYRCGGVGDEFSFKTAPASLPIEFAVVGDLGQTEWTVSTLAHIGKSDYDMLLLPGDLSYADSQQPLWDSFGRLIQPYASSRPWMVTEGNHEVEALTALDMVPFIAYNHRWRMPYEESKSTSNLYYSFNVAGAVHVIMLGSYTEYGPDSAQYKWLVSDLAKVDRSVTPWLIVLLHAPWYNTNTAHQGEGEKMRKAMEALLYRAHVDIVFAGHVHAYERFTRIHNNAADSCGPVYITIGDGGNREGLALHFNPSHKSASLSVFREASFGHGRLKIIDGKKAHWSWHRNNDSDATVADELWLVSLSSSSPCQDGTKAKDEL
ncbi:Purple acid phosphatase [Rhynchospora pubera]|uniref:Purple acid phosphatase n=1 Tax=Rhynchospora pubera TaxID=906938 RepID=A0AAV8DCV6_9POAL|nr:Purple acid phosphatase [Rhynchospora pubera]